MSVLGGKIVKEFMIIDEVYVEREIETKAEFPFVMTTWHNKESLDDALWFALFCTEPYEDSADSTISTLILNVKDEERDIHLRNTLSDLDKFNEDALRVDDEAVIIDI